MKERKIEKRKTENKTKLRGEEARYYNEIFGHMQNGHTHMRADA